MPRLHVTAAVAEASVRSSLVRGLIGCAPNHESVALARPDEAPKSRRKPRVAGKAITTRQTPPRLAAVLNIAAERSWQAATKARAKRLTLDELYADRLYPAGADSIGGEPEMTEVEAAEYFARANRSWARREARIDATIAGLDALGVTADWSRVTP